MWSFLRQLLRRKTETKSLPRHVALDLEVVDAAMVTESGFPRPDWGTIGRWIEGRMHPHDRFAGFSNAAERWLEKTRRTLGPPFGLYESADFLLLTPEDKRAAMEMLDVAEATYQWLFETLEAAPDQQRQGKLAILCFLGDRALFDDYMTVYATDGRDFTNSAAVFLGDAYPHIVLGSGDHVMHSLVHELTHALLSGLPLPRWVGEGVAQVAAEAVVPERSFVNHAPDFMHQVFWAKHTLGSFWNGQAFFNKESRRLSYDLAEVLIRNLLSNHRRRFPHFLLNASREDAGAEAAEQCFGQTLADLAAQFLGPGPWEDHGEPKAWRSTGGEE